MDPPDHPNGPDAPFSPEDASALTELREAIAEIRSLRRQAGIGVLDGADLVLWAANAAIAIAAIVAAPVTGGVSLFALLIPVAAGIIDIIHKTREIVENRRELKERERILGRLDDLEATLRRRFRLGPDRGR